MSIEISNVLKDLYVYYPDEIRLNQLTENPSDLYKVFEKLVAGNRLEELPCHLKMKFIHLVEQNCSERKSTTNKLNTRVLKVLNLNTNKVEVEFKSKKGKTVHKEVSKFFLATLIGNKSEDPDNPIVIDDSFTGFLFKKVSNFFMNSIMGYKLEGLKGSIVIDDSMMRFLLDEQNFRLPIPLTKEFIDQMITFAEVFECDIGEKLNSIGEYFIDEENLAFLLEIATKMQATELKTKCFKYIEKNSHIRLVADHSGTIEAQIYDFRNVETLKKYLDILTPYGVEITMSVKQPSSPDEVVNFLHSFADKIVNLNLSIPQFSRDSLIADKILASSIIGELTNLRSLDLTRCKALTTLDGLCSLKNLTSLELGECEALTTVDGLGKLTNLTSLNLSRCKALTAVDGLGKLTNLRSLNLSWCEALAAVDVSHLTSLTSLDLRGCKALTAVDVSHLTSLTSLGLRGCRALTAVDVSQLTNLTLLDLGECVALKAVDGLGELTKLTWLDLHWCKALKAVDLSHLTNLTSLNLTGCKALTTLDVSQLTNLTWLELGGCEALTTVDVSQLTNLTSFNLDGCRALTSVDGLGKLTNLKSLDLHGCRALTAVDGLGNLTNLTRLDLHGCIHLTTVDVSQLTNLTSLRLSDCGKLKNINLSGCSRLENVWGLDELMNLRSLNISGCNEAFKLERLRLFLQLMSDEDENIVKVNRYKINFGLDCVTDISFLIKTIVNNPSEELKNNFFTLLDKVDSVQAFNDALEFACLLPSLELKNKFMASMLQSKVSDLDVEKVKGAIHFFAKNHAEVIKDILEEPTIIQYLTAIRFEIEVSPHISIGFLLEKYLSEEIILDDTFILNDVFMNYLNHEKNKNEVIMLLSKYRDTIHNKCENLKAILQQKFPEDKYPQLYPIIVSPGYRRLSITLSRYHLKNEPKEIFIKLAEHILNPNILGTQVRFTGEESIAIDAGALSRQFFSELVSDFVLKENLTASMPKTSIKTLKCFGAVLGFLYKYNITLSSGSPILTGASMSEEIYRGMLEFSHEDLQCQFSKITPLKQLEIYKGFLEANLRRLEEFSEKKDYERIAEKKQMIEGLIDFISLSNQQNISEKILKFIKDIVGTYYLTENDLMHLNAVGWDQPLEKMNTRVIQENLESWQNCFKNNLSEFMGGDLEKLHAIASGMKCDINTWKKIQGGGWDALRIDIEGEFSSEKFVECFKFDENVSKRFQDKFAKWSSNMDDAEKKRFLVHLTGSPAIPNKKITIETTAYGGVVMHACSFLVTIGTKGIEEIIAGMNTKIEENKTGEKLWNLDDFILLQFDQVIKGSEEIKYDIA